MSTQAQAIAKIAVECREFARLYTDTPGLAGNGANAGTIVDIYETLAQIADELVQVVQPTGARVS